MKWTKLKAFQLASAIGSLLVIFCYVFNYFKIDFGFLDEDIKSIFGLIKEFGFSLSDIIDEFGSVFSLFDSESIVKVIIALFFVFIVPVILCLISSIFEFVWFAKDYKKKSAHTISLAAVTYTIVSNIFVAFVVANAKKEMGDEFGFMQDVFGLSTGYYFQWILCVAIIALSALALLEIKKSDSKSETLSETDVGLIGVNGMWKGAEFFNNTGELLTLGRDSKQCNIVINTAAESVSRRHCTVKYDYQANDYIVTDYSSNGTFAKGSRLQHGTPTHLSCRTIISLGDEMNTFMLN